MTGEQFFSMLDRTRQTTFFPQNMTRNVYGDEFEAVLLAIPFRRYVGQYHGHMVFYFDRGQMEKNFAPLLESGASYIGIYGMDGDPLMEWGNTTLNPEKVLEQKKAQTTVKSKDGKQHVFYRKLKNSGLFMWAEIPNHIFIDRNAYLLWAVGAGIALFMLLAIALTFAVSRYNRKPISQIIDLLPLENESIEPGLWPMKKAVERLLLDQENLNGLLNIRDTQLRDATVSALIKGNFSSEQEMEFRLAHTGIQLEGDEWYGVYMTLPQQPLFGEESIEKTDYRYMKVTGTLSMFTPTLQFLTLGTHKEYILLYSKMDDRSPEAYFSEVALTIHEHCGMDSMFYVGIACNSLNTLNQSFSTAHALMLGGEEDGRVVHVAQRRPLNKAVYEYTLQDENALIAAVQSGERENVNRVLDSVKEKNFSHRTFSGFMRQSLYMSMMHTLSRFDCSLILPTQMTNVPLNMEPEQFFEELGSIYDSLIEQTQSGRQRAGMMLMEDVMQYIQKNYADCNLSLTMLSQQFGLTEPYLSKRFKQYAGTNFSTYLEQLRIDQAKNLLSTTHLSIQTISDEVGYTNIRSFRRAYIRVMGCAPSVGRDNEKTKKTEEDSTVQKEGGKA